MVYAVGHAGRMIATQARSGERLWSINLPGTQMPYVAGDAVFVVDVNGQLVAVSRRDGKILWTVRLPRREDVVGSSPGQRQLVGRVQ